MKLSFNTLPEYIFSSWRNFFDGEHHIKRCIDESVLILVYQGELRFEENGIPVALHANEYYIQRPFTKQTGNAKCSAPKYFYIHFHGEYDELHGLPLRGTFDERHLKPFIEDLNNLGHDASKLEFHKCFYSILFELSKNDNVSPAQQIKNYLLQHYDSALTLDDVSRDLNFSKNHLIRLFRAQYGKTPYRFLTEYRLEKAKQLLSTTNRSCQTIANDVGFDRYSVFYKAFLNYYKITPTQFLLENRK